MNRVCRDLERPCLNRLILFVSRLAKSPGRYAIVRGNIRRCMLRRFPYGVYFRETNDEIRILVIKHHSRHPDYGLDRE